MLVLHILFQRPIGLFGNSILEENFISVQYLGTIRPTSLFIPANNCEVKR